MGFPADNRAYEAWLRTQCRVVDDDLGYKHERMKESAFVFLRATFFRWARRVEGICPDLAGAPKVLAVGDVHVENFGTWRDSRRSPRLGRERLRRGCCHTLRLRPDPAGDQRALGARPRPRQPQGRRRHLEGYRDGLANPRPILLDEQETWMREHVVCSDEERAKFWDEVDGYPRADPTSRGRRRPCAAACPRVPATCGSRPRRKGGGSLGRPRYVAVAKWRGGRDRPGGEGPGALGLGLGACG